MEAKRKRNVLTLPQKMEIINLVNSGETRRSIAKKYSVGSTTISDLYKNRESIIHFMSVTKDEESYHNRRTMRKPHNDKVDRAVFIWFRQLRSSGKPVSGPAICDKALFFNEKFGGGPEFKASNGWLRNFKVRHGIQKIENHDETPSINPKDTSRTYADLSGLIQNETQSSGLSNQADGLNTSTKPPKSLTTKFDGINSNLPYLGDEEIFRFVEEEHRENSKKIAAIAESIKAAKKEKAQPPTMLFRLNSNGSPLENNEGTKSYIHDSISDNFYASHQNNQTNSKSHPFNSIIGNVYSHNIQRNAAKNRAKEKPNEIPSPCEAYAHFGNIIDWYSSQNGNCPAQLQALQQLKNLAAKKSDASKSLEIVMRWCKSQKECNPEQLEALRKLHNLATFNKSTN